MLKVNFFFFLPIIASFRKSARWGKILKNGRGKNLGACLNQGLSRVSKE